jgi:hypothetical protein
MYKNHPLPAPHHLPRNELAGVACLTLFSQSLQQTKIFPKILAEMAAGRLHEMVKLPAIWKWHDPRMAISAPSSGGRACRATAASTLTVLGLPLNRMTIAQLKECNVVMQLTIGLW